MLTYMMSVHKLPQASRNQIIKPETFCVLESTRSFLSYYIPHIGYLILLRPPLIVSSCSYRFV